MMESYSGILRISINERQSESIHLWIEEANYQSQTTGTSRRSLFSLYALVQVGAYQSKRRV